LDKKLSLYSSYAKACNASKTFKDGILLLDKLEAKNKDECLKNMKIILWRI